MRLLSAVPAAVTVSALERLRSAVPDLGDPLPRPPPPARARPRADGARAAGSSTLRPIAVRLSLSGETTATRDTMPVTCASTLAIGPIPRGIGARTTSRS